MNSYCFVGEDLNLGRHGFVISGDKIQLTPEEEKTIGDDQRFEPWDEGKHARLAAAAQHKRKGLARKASDERAAAAKKKSAETAPE